MSSRVRASVCVCVCVRARTCALVGVRETDRETVKTKTLVSMYATTNRPRETRSAVHQFSLNSNWFYLIKEH